MTIVSHFRAQFITQILCAIKNGKWLYSNIRLDSKHAISCGSWKNACLRKRLVEIQNAENPSILILQTVNILGIN